MNDSLGSRSQLVNVIHPLFIHSFVVVVVPLFFLDISIATVIMYSSIDSLTIISFTYLLFWIFDLYEG